MQNVNTKNYFSYNSENMQHIITNSTNTVYNTIRKYLCDCDEFYISVAFVTESGIQSLKKTFLDLEEKNIPGKIVTGNFQMFNSPIALNKLNEFKNIDVRLDLNNNLHTKGYFFRKNDQWTIMIGSSNLTANAIFKNQEWNMLITSDENSKLVQDALIEFDNLFNNSSSLISTIDSYTSIYNDIKTMNKNFPKSKIKEEVKPNNMQKEALLSLKQLRDNNENKALIISATGSGKTYLAAFDVQAFNPKKCLFIAHRNEILLKTKETFDSLLGNINSGLLDGKSKDLSKDFLFANITTLAKDDNLTKFNREHFDYIIIDEVHKSGAASYEKVIDYFNPQFLLGLTATPERMDNYDIYKHFDYNTAYEIRMKDAINEELIVPFHYYGVSELEFDGKVVDEDNLIHLDMEQRVDHTLEKSKLYGCCGEIIRGLIFVSSTNEAIKFAEILNKKGYNAVALTGNDSSNTRHDAIRKIQSDGPDRLDYIITVDIFNEGVDIPKINQVILQRPTQSSIVYVQQIGRGLRKTQDKEYLVIIDFIGNYKNNFMIPIALTSDKTYAKDSLNIAITNTNALTPDLCTMEFEKIARDIILNNITQTNFSTQKLVNHDYTYLKNKLGRIPLITDFYNNNLISFEYLYAAATKLKQNRLYYDLINKYENEIIYQFSNEENFFLRFISSEITPSKRIHEILIIKYLLENTYASKLDIIDYIENYIGFKDQEENVDNAILHLQNRMFTTENSRAYIYKSLGIDNKYALLNTNNISLNDDFVNSYQNNEKFKLLIDDLINFNILFVQNEYRQLDNSPLIKYKTYSRNEAFKLLNSDYNPGLQQSGYIENKLTDSVYIFLKLDKSNYDNEFIDKKRFIWMSQMNKSLNKINGSRLEKAMLKNEKTLYIFIQMTKGEKFYFLGNAKMNNGEDTFKDGKSVIKYEVELDDAVPDELFNYFTDL